MLSEQVVVHCSSCRAPRAEQGACRVCARRRVEQALFTTVISAAVTLSAIALAVATGHHV